MHNYNYVNCPGPGDFVLEDDPNDDVYEADLDQLRSMLAYCELDPDDLIGVPAWKRLRWSLALDYRAKLIRERIFELEHEVEDPCYTLYTDTCEACQ